MLTSHVDLRAPPGPRPLGGTHSAMHVQLGSETELIKLCVALPPSILFLCLLEDHEGPYADTEFLFRGFFFFLVGVGG